MEFSSVPIGISTYSRIHHLQQTVEALKSNTLASESELFIFSDAPKPGDEDIVNKLRAYVHTITGFKKVHIIERSTNGRVKNNRGGIRYLLDIYGKCIFMEDDIVTAQGFLQYMNDALNYYEKDEKIISITGYAPPFKNLSISRNDVFFLQRFNGWGVGFWKEKYEKIEEYLDKKDVLLHLNDSSFLNKLCSNGIDIPQMLMLEIDGKIDALDVKIMYQQVLNNWFTIYPKKSLVQNIGHDGSGVHCGVSDRFHHSELWDKTKNFVFNDDIKPNQAIIKANFDFRFSMNSFAKELIVADLVEKIEKLESDSFSIYGIGELAELLIESLHLGSGSKKVRYLIDSNVKEKKISFHRYEIISPEVAIAKGETNFVLASWNGREVLREKLIQLTSDNIAIKILSPEICN